jgi:translation initiation factor IF-2, N-terminal domain protein
MGKNKNKQKELVNDLDIKNIGQIEAKSVESTVDNSIEKDNKIKELEKEIKRWNNLEEELNQREEKLNSRDNQIKLLEEKLKDEERSLQTQRKELEASLEKDRNFLEVEIKRVDSLEKSINKESERLSEKANKLNDQEIDLKEREIKINEKEKTLEEDLRKERTRFELEEKNKVREELNEFYENEKKVREDSLNKEIDKKRKEDLKEIEKEKEKEEKILEELKKEIEKISNQKIQNENEQKRLELENKRISQFETILESKISEEKERERKKVEIELNQEKEKFEEVSEKYKEVLEKLKKFNDISENYGSIENIHKIIKDKEKQIKDLNKELVNRPTNEALEGYNDLKKELEDYKNKNKDLNDELNNYDTEIIEVDTLKREKRNLMNQIDSLILDYTHEKEEKEKLSARLSRIMTPEGALLTEAERIQQIKGSGLDYEAYPEKYLETDINELSWLEKIEKTSEEYGIKLNKRILYAFHTALKISDWSIITVLAGVSGTGKSELPKLYARFGGLNFISVPVQPNWDSQESMLGYFNSIDNRFDTQPLLRFLANCIDEEKYNKYMSLVLLDEMNLAHVEHYFAEFLSKLEERRGKVKKDLPYIEVKLGADCNSLKLKLIRNILWAGTMNQDETTKSLSDKVLDRGIIINFPRPKILESRKEMKNINKIIENKKLKMLTKDIWDTWVINRKEDTSSDAQKKRMKEYKKIIEDINDELEKVGRALGHRVWQSIEHYICNHPYVISQFQIEKEQGKDLGEELSNELKNNMDLAFEDQIVQKVMPKLRGIETRGKGQEVLDEILKILSNENFDNLKRDFNFAKEQGFGQFVWGSAYYLNEGEFELSNNINEDDEIKKEE